MSHVQIVPPATAGRETLWMVLCAAAIVSIAAWSVHVRLQPEVSPHLTGHGVDARSDLSPAEQGLHADLQVAADDIHTHHRQRGQWPTVDELAAQGLPPFVPGFDTRARGDHRWQRITAGAHVAYVGRPAVSGGTRAVLLRIDASGTDDAVWIHTPDKPSGDVDTALHPDADALLSAGWRPVVHTYDAGVTRHAH